VAASKLENENASYLMLGDAWWSLKQIPRAFTTEVKHDGMAK
jgi:hypothetical protein